MFPHALLDLRHFRFVSDQTLAMFKRSCYTIDQVDPEIFAAIQKENQRQENHIELIASGNYTSLAVMATQGSQLTSRYAEGYSGKCYHGGCGYVDVVERLVIDHVKQLFGAEAADMQSSSGLQADRGVFFAVLKPGDTVMGISLAEGDHLTRGMALNMSGKWFNVVSYGLSAQEDVDYDTLEALAQEKRPKLIITGASVFTLRIGFERIGEIAESIGAYFMVDMTHYADLIAAGVYPNPVPHADFITTTTHKSLRGPRGGIILMKAKREEAINSAIFPGIQGGPLVHVITGEAVTFKEALSPEFKAYQQQVVENTAAMTETLMARGLRVASGRTENHVTLVGLRAKKITSKKAEKVLDGAHITVNKNAIPNGPEEPFVALGVHLGSPAMTTRGFKEAEAVKVAHLTADMLDNSHSGTNIAAVRAKVAELTKQFPAYD